VPTTLLSLVLFVTLLARDCASSWLEMLFVLSASCLRSERLQSPFSSG